MPATQSDTAIRHHLIAQLAAARQQTDDLFGIVKRDSLYERPIAERHRIIFYIGHLEAFDWNLLHDRVLGVKSFHPEFDRLFAFCARLNCAAARKYRTHHRPASLTICVPAPIWCQHRLFY